MFVFKGWAVCRHLEKSGNLEAQGGGKKQTSRLVSREQCANEKECGKKM